MRPAFLLLAALGAIALGWNYWATHRPPRPAPNVSGRFSSGGAIGATSGPSTTLEGIVRMTGSTSHNAHVDLVRVSPNGVSRVYAADEALNDGRFSFNRVMKDRYWIVARTEVDPDPMRPGEGVPQVFYGLSETLSDGEHPSHVRVELFPAASLSGRLTFEPASSPAVRDLARLTVSLFPIDTQAKAAIATGDASAAVSADGQFTIPEIPPGQYRLDVSPNAWMLDTVTVSSHDGLDRPFNVAAGEKLSAAITLVERASAIGGTLRDASGHGVPYGLVSVFPVDLMQRESHRRVQLIRSDGKGVFRFEGLPSGEYLLAAAGGFDPVSWRTPDFFQQLMPLAMHVTLVRGRSQTYDLRVTPR